MPDNFEPYWKKIHTVSYLENIRMLFSYMEELNYRYRQSQGEKHRYSGYSGEGGLRRRSQILKDLAGHIEHVTKDSLDHSSDTKSRLLYQHPLSSYLSFYLKLFSSQKINRKLPHTLGQELAPMLNYFNILQYLTDEEFAQERESPDHHGALPYFYEDLCLSIREITDCQACFLLYFEKGERTELIARSGYIVDLDAGAAAAEDALSNFNIKISELDSIIKCCGSSQDIRYSVSRQGLPPAKLTFSNVFQLVDGIKLIQGKTAASPPPHDYLVFEFPYFSEGHQSENDRSFYLLLDYKEKSGSGPLSEETAKAAALKILFLRKRLWDALRQDYAELIDYRFDCSYIKPVHEDGSPVIMHISDSHLIDDETWAPGGDRCEKFCAHLSKEHGGKIDLLAVTGDIVLASRHASDAQAKYHRIGQLLREIAVNLWASKSKNRTLILPHDWKRRIMIITGNHDYAAMNDVMVETGGRRIKTAGPAGHSGGTMSKFTYYIEFLINFLDAPIDELLENDLNEVRDYKYLGLTAAMINTSSKANSLQNNKVAINTEKVLRLIQQTPWNESDQSRRYIALMHHTPNYKIDYLADKYEIQKFYKSSAGGLNENIYSNYIKLLKKTAEEWPELPELTPKEWGLVSQIRTILRSRNDKQFMGSELKRDMSMLVSIFDSGGADVEDEFHYEFISKTRNLLEIQRHDQEHFDKACDILFGEKKTIILGGHEHRNLYREYKSNPTFIIGKMYGAAGKAGSKEPETISYLTVTPDASSGSPKVKIYKFFQSSFDSRSCPCDDFDPDPDKNTCSSVCFSKSPPSHGTTGPSGPLSP